MAEEINKYSELLTRVIMRLEKIWEKGEGSLTIEIRNDNDKKRGKIEGGEVERI